MAKKVESDPDLVFDATLKPRRKHQEAFKYAFAVVNMLSGNVVTFHDDGCTKEGAPNQQRQHCRKKLRQRDDDGDPIWVLAGDIPAFMVGKDHDQRSSEPLSIDFPKLDDPSRSKKFDTLREKAAANRKAHRAEQAKAESKAARVNMPPQVQAFMEQVADAVGSNANKDRTTAARGGV